MNLQDTAAELRRLHRIRQEYLHRLHSHEPGFAERWRQVVYRYDQLLDHAAAMLDIPWPVDRDFGDCYRPDERTELETRLAHAGLLIRIGPDQGLQR